MLLLNGIVFILVGMTLYFFIRGSFVLRKYLKKEHNLWGKETLLFLFALYLCMVVSVTLFPFPIIYDREIDSGLSTAYMTVNWVPLVAVFHDLSQIGVAYSGDTWFMVGLIIRNIGGNILLLMPLGYLVPLLWESFKLKQTLLLGLCISVLIEFSQYWEIKIGAFGRVTDIDDVIFNVLGSYLGYMFYKLTIMIFKNFVQPIVARKNSKSYSTH